MSTLGGAALLYLACVHLYLTDQRHSAVPLRALALLPTVAAFVVFRQHEGGPAPYFLVIGGLTACGTVVALLAAVWMRAVWALSIVATCVVVAGFL